MNNDSLPNLRGGSFNLILIILYQVLKKKECLRHKRCLTMPMLLLSGIDKTKMDTLTTESKLVGCIYYLEKQRTRTKTIKSDNFFRRIKRYY